MGRWAFEYSIFYIHSFILSFHLNIARIILSLIHFKLANRQTMQIHNQLFVLIWFFISNEHFLLWKNWTGFTEGGNIFSFLFWLVYCNIHPTSDCIAMCVCKKPPSPPQLMLLLLIVINYLSIWYFFGLCLLMVYLTPFIK